MGNWKTSTNLKYAKSDEWLLLEGDDGTIGISDYAQDQLNDIVFIELPSVGKEFAKGASFGTVESVKAASDLVMPIGGKVVEINKELEKNPELINSDPFGKGWMIKIKVTDASGAADLMDSAAYVTYCEGR